MASRVTTTPHRYGCNVPSITTSHRQAMALGACLGVLALATPMTVRADEPLRAGLVDQPSEQGDDARHRIDRTWLYGDDARVPVPMTAVATSSLSYTSVGDSPTRVSFPQPGAEASCVNARGGAQPCYASFANNTAQPGGMMLLAGELGLLPRTSLQGSVMGGLGAAAGPSLGASASLRFSVLPDSAPLHLVLSGGYIREAWGRPVYVEASDKWLPGSPSGDDGAFFRVAVSGDIGRLRLASTVHGEHVFADGRDPLDMMVNVGASFQIVHSFRAGLEYVGQDLEEAFTPGAEGTARHFLGPIASVQLLHDRLTIVGGPSIGLSRLSPDFVGRVAASLGF